VCCTPGPGICPLIHPCTPWCQEGACLPMARTGSPHGKPAWGMLRPSLGASGPSSGSTDHRLSGARLSIHRCGKETGWCTVSRSVAERQHGGLWPPPAVEGRSALTASCSSKPVRSHAALTKPKPVSSATPRSPPRRSAAACGSMGCRIGSSTSATTGFLRRPIARCARRPERCSGAGPRELKQPAPVRLSKHTRPCRAAPHVAAFGSWCRRSSPTPATLLHRLPPRAASSGQGER